LSLGDGHVLSEARQITYAEHVECVQQMEVRNWLWDSVNRLS
jgi:hypothetical protein